jgi:hypothetical protein
MWLSELSHLVALKQWQCSKKWVLFLPQKTLMRQILVDESAGSTPRSSPPTPSTRGRDRGGGYMVTILGISSCLVTVSEEDRGVFATGACLFDEIDRLHCFLSSLHDSARMHT